MKNDLITKYRNFLKDSVRKEIDFSATDQHKGLEAPPIQKPYASGKRIIQLPKKDEWQTINKTDLIPAIEERKSERKFIRKPLSLEEISFLLWATQGIKKHNNPATAFRTVPSAGCRHSFETYLCVFNVQSLEQGIYRYLPIEHAIIFERSIDDISEKLDNATLNQHFISSAPVTFIWTTVPYRMEWRYDIAAHRVILIDVGHVCQNLYLACKAIGAGTCAIAAYDQEKMDKLLNVDGEEEFVIYLAPVGKV